MNWVSLLIYAAGAFGILVTIAEIGGEPFTLGGAE